jgi:hypothetical protein
MLGMVPETFLMPDPVPSLLKRVYLEKWAFLNGISA